MTLVGTNRRRSTVMSKSSRYPAGSWTTHAYIHTHKHTAGTEAGGCIQEFDPEFDGNFTMEGISDRVRQHSPDVPTKAVEAASCKENFLPTTKTPKDDDPIPLKLITINGTSTGKGGMVERRPTFLEKSVFCNASSQTLVRPRSRRTGQTHSAPKYYWQQRCRDLQKSTMIYNAANY